jgi:hypothetical protein
MPARGYAGGVPMGGDLAPRPRGLAADIGPTFVVSALADPGVAGSPGTPLQRIQIIKGWSDGSATHEVVYDVAGTSRNGASVDTRTCQRRGAGDQSLCRVWRDPTFDATHSAFYYARVVENPTCRWSQRVCLAAGVDCSKPDDVPEAFEACCSEAHRPVIQERAWTSPIWYTPLEH